MRSRRRSSVPGDGLSDAAGGRPGADGASDGRSRGGWRPVVAEKPMDRGSARGLPLSGPGVERLVDEVWEEATRRPTVVLFIVDPVLRAEIRRSLLRSLFTVLEPPAGELAPETGGMFPPDAIVVDVRDPRDNGWMTVRRLRDDPRTERVGVVALVTQPEEADLWWARRLAVGRLLPVPWEGDDLLRAVEGVMVT